MNLYEYLLSKKGIRISEVITIFLPKIMETKEWAEYDTFDSAYRDIRAMIIARIQNAVDNRNVPGKIKYVESTAYCDEFGVPEHEVDVFNSYVRTSNVINWAVTAGYLGTDARANVDLALSMTGTPDTRTIEESGHSTVVPEQEAELALYGDKLEQIDNAGIPWLKKKVKELTNEKAKWDRSIEIASGIGLLFYEKELQKPATEPAFKAEYQKWFDGIPKKTVSMIYKSLPEGYRNTGTRPTTKVDGIDEDMVDTIMEASVAAGFITQKEGTKDFKELKCRLEADDYEVPPDSYIKRIVGTCKRVALKNR